MAKGRTRRCVLWTVFSRRWTGLDLSSVWASAGLFDRWTDRGKWPDEWPDDHSWCNHRSHVSADIFAFVQVLSFRSTASLYPAGDGLWIIVPLYGRLGLRRFMLLTVQVTDRVLLHRLTNQSRCPRGRLGYASQTRKISRLLPAI